MIPFKAFIINLERDGLRRGHMERELDKRGMHAEFLPAVDGSCLSEADRNAYDAEKAMRVYGVPMMDTEIACYLSHYRLWERIARDDIKFSLIMEDDIEIDPALPRIVEDLINDPAPEWLVVRLESLRGGVRNPKKLKFLGKITKHLHDAKLYKLNTHVLGFGAYLIRKEGAERMLEYGRRIFMPVDQTTDRYWENGIVPYIVRPLPVHQRQDFESRIGARPPGRHLGQPLGLRLQRRRQRIWDGIRKRVFSLMH
jgi:glycosyl transferase family 25